MRNIPPIVLVLVSSFTMEVGPFIIELCFFVVILSRLSGKSNFRAEWHLLLLLEIMLCFQLVLQKGVLSLCVDQSILDFGIADSDSV